MRAEPPHHRDRPFDRSSFDRSVTGAGKPIASRPLALTCLVGSSVSVYLAPSPCLLLRDRPVWLRGDVEVGSCWPERAKREDLGQQCAYRWVSDAQARFLGTGVPQ